MSRNDGFVTYVNQYALDWTGKTLEQLEGDGWTVLIHPDERERAFDVWHKAARENTEQATEILFLHRDGTYRALFISVFPVRDGEGAVQSWIGTAHEVVDDLTERKRTELNLAFLAEITDDLANLETIGGTMRAVGAKIGSHFNLSACAFADIDEASGRGLIEYEWHRDDAPSVVGEYRISDVVNESFLADVRAGKTVVVRDTATDPRSNPATFGALEIGSFINIPLFRDGQWRFQLALFDSAPRDWRNDEIVLVRELSTRIWMRLERARAEETLAKSAEKYRTLINSIDEGFCIIRVLFDEHGKCSNYVFLETNPAFVRQTGLEDAVGKSIRELAPEHEEFWFEAYGRIAKNRKPEHIKHEAAALNRFFEVYAFPIGIEDEHQVAVIFNEISERKQAEEALRESEERFRGVFENAAVGVALANLKGDWQRVNDAFCRITGYTREELLGKNFSEITHPLDRASSKAQIPRLRETSDYHSEQRYIAKTARLFGLVLLFRRVATSAGSWLVLSPLPPTLRSANWRRKLCAKIVKGCWQHTNTLMSASSNPIPEADIFGSTKNFAASRAMKGQNFFAWELRMSLILKIILTTSNYTENWSLVRFLFIKSKSGMCGGTAQLF